MKLHDKIYLSKFIGISRHKKHKSMESVVENRWRQNSFEIDDFLQPFVKSRNATCLSSHQVACQNHHAH